MSVTVRLASWNVNSLKMRLTQLLDWLDTSQTDAVVLQETKTVDELFPKDALAEAGFDAVFTGQKSFNGVALLTRRATMEAPEDVLLSLPGLVDPQRRFVSARLKPRGAGADHAFRFVGGYFPNGNVPGSWKYLYKLDWIRALQCYLEETLRNEPRLVLGGDFNIAPEDRDVWSAAALQGSVLITEPERRAFAALTRLGLTDSFRRLCNENERFSMWDYRARAFELNRGFRIDHLLVSDALLGGLSAADIDSAPRSLSQPSDHAPVTVTLTL